MLNFLYTLIIFPLVQIIEFSFKLFYDLFKDNGVAVIGVSVTVSLLCLPLYVVAEHWQEVQRATEKKLDPGIKRIKSVFKGDEQYMILSTFYKENHYHPLMALRSSFGLLIQIPFFIAAYSFLSNLPALKGSSFFFIKDMGAQDAMFHIGSFPVNVLPIVMTLINIVAGAIYTKGFKFKDKFTIYGMALVFLVILYSSPSGLVLYWTMNNIFSLVKNIFYKIKNPLKVFYAIAAVCIISLDIYLLFFKAAFLRKRLVLACVVSLLFFIPLLAKFFSNKLDTFFKPLVENKKTRFGIFLLSVLALFIYSGIVIPSTVIGSSPSEFADIDGYGSPLYFVFNSAVQSFGLCVLWLTCVYFLFSARVQAGFAVVISSFTFAALLDAFAFGGEYGTLSRLITFSENPKSPSYAIAAINVVLALLVMVLPSFLLKIKKRIILSNLLLIILISGAVVSLVNIFKIQKGYVEYKNTVAKNLGSNDSVAPVFHLTKTGKNVFVFMLDAAENSYADRIFEVFPELYDEYDGFTLYKNIVSYNGSTLLAAPALYGGYEYTPYEINKRKDERLVDKQNEALLLLPRIFTEQGDFEATVSDLSWANYSIIPDMSITNPYPKITGLNIQKKYTDLYIQENPDKVKPNITSRCLKRNLVWFSLFKFVPYPMRDSVYHSSDWWSTDSQATDIMEFIDSYSVLAYLPQLTDFSSEKDAYFTITNETTHSGQELQAPNYEPAIEIDKSKKKSEVENYDDIDTNIAALKRIGEWLEYLKQNGCYDNSRIILVSDHGNSADKPKELDYTGDFPFDYNPGRFHPLLMVKDFNAHGKLNLNYDFMTNADVPAIATKGIFEHPVNPTTKKEIVEVSPASKKASGVVFMPEYQANGNNTFNVPDKYWYTVSKNVFDATNWQQGVK